ncbi:hypothetical protein ALC53_11392 [Atta colombica]|uniref:Uncharacterized protein n=1 Tax=Atta colombica TaxID=520822 RepID=A0A195B1P0_9HYME|nr:hypothetical protein ALC53_11392 [Atta colombica]
MASLKYVVVLSLLMMMLAHCYAENENGNPEHPPLQDNTFESSDESVNSKTDESVNSKTDKPGIEPKMFYASVNA